MFLFSRNTVPEVYSRGQMWDLLSKIVFPLSRIVEGYLFTTVDGAPVTGDTELSASVDFCPVDATSAVAIKLPPANQCKGKRFTIKKVSGPNVVTISVINGDTIDDHANVTISNIYTSLCFMSDGKEYWIV